MKNKFLAIFSKEQYSLGTYSYEGRSDVRYYAFGSVTPGRSFTSASYRYGFNGKEKDNEVSGEGNSYDFGARMYDSRLGKWLGCDPLAHTYPSHSPYNYTLNNPIFFIDKDGRTVFDKNGVEVKMFIKKGELTIANANAIDPELVTVIQNTFKESKIGQTTITNLNDPDVRVQVEVSSKIGVLTVNDEEGNPHYGIVQGLTSPSKDYDAKVTVYQPTDGNQTMPSPDVNVEVIDVAGKVVPKEEMKNLKNYDQDHFDAKSKSKSTKEGLEALTVKDKATLGQVRKEGATNKAFGRASTLIHETIHALFTDKEKPAYQAEVDSYNQKNTSKK